MRCVVYFSLTTNLGEILTLVLALAIGLDLPMTAVMILWINLVTDGARTVALGVEPKHSNVLKHPPVHTPIGHTLLGTTGLSAMDWVRILAVSSSIWVADEVLKSMGVYGMRPSRA